MKHTIVREITLPAPLDRVPALLYEEPSWKVWLYVHGRHGCKEEAGAFAALACPKGWQVLSADLPAHGGRLDPAGDGGRLCRAL